MSRVRFVSASSATTYDSKHDRIVRFVVLIDSKGRRWEEYDGGEPVLVESPDDPDGDSPNASNEPTT